jgi:hypothetical protein
MSRPYRNLAIAAGVGLISELWPMPGALLAAVVFREGIHSAHPTAYIALTLVLNFLIFGGLTYFIADAVGKPKVTPKARNSTGDRTACERRPLHGIGNYGIQKTRPDVRPSSLPATVHSGFLHKRPSSPLAIT